MLSNFYQKSSRKLLTPVPSNVPHEILNRFGKHTSEICQSHFLSGVPHQNVVVEPGFLHYKFLNSAFNLKGQFGTSMCKGSNVDIMGEN